MPLIFEDGFESGDFTAWSLVNADPETTVDITNIVAEVYSGIYAGRVTIAGTGNKRAYLLKTLDVPLPLIYVRAYFKVSNPPAQAVPPEQPRNYHLITLGSTGLAGAIGFGMLTSTYDGLTRWRGDWYDGVEWHNPTGPVVSLDPNKWYCIEVMVAVGDAPNGAVAMWVDGVLMFEVTGVKTNYNGYEGSQVNVGASWIQEAADLPIIVVDSVVVADEYIGPGPIPPPPEYGLELLSSPEQGALMKVDTQYFSTNIGAILSEGVYTIVAPANYTYNGVWYFQNWEDGSTERVRTINLTSNMSVTAYYVAEVPPPLPPPLPPPTEELIPLVMIVSPVATGLIILGAITI